jgi:hypothetical protein
MRFMMIVKSGADIEKGCMPSEQELARMGEYNEELVKAGALLAAEGLHPSARGARVTFSGGKPTVTDGPFAEAKELVAGFWLIQVKSLEEATEWARRIPFDDGVVELRQVFEACDFGESYTPEIREMEERQRAAMAAAA